MLTDNAQYRWVAWGVIVASLTGTSPAAARDDAPPALEAPVPGAAEPIPSAAPAGVSHEALRAGNAPGEPTRAPQPPPAPMAERPTGNRPFGDAQWIAGYWNWDTARGDFVWVAGMWKVPPPSAIWVNGRWVRDDQGWSRVPGYWSQRQARRAERDAKAASWRQTGPPTATPADDPGVAPASDAVLVPGHYAPRGDRVVWIPGYWTRDRDGFAWVPARWVHHPEGWDYREGYWVREPDRHVVGRPPLNASRDSDGDSAALPPKVVESRPSAVVASGPTALEPLPSDDGPPPAVRDPIGENEKAPPPSVVVQPPSVVVVPAPYPLPYPMARGPYLLPPGYGPRFYDPLNVVPPFAKRIIDRYVP